MDRNNKVLLMAMCFAFLSTFAMAETIFGKPGKNDVILVGRVSTSSINDEFYARYFGSRFGKQKKHTLWFGEVKVYASIEEVWTRSMGDVGSVFFYKKNVKDVTEICIDGFTMTLFNNFFGAIYLPVNAYVKIPSGAKYLYIGDIDYTFADNHFIIGDIELSDNFDEAASLVKKEYGDDAELVRAVLKPVK